MTKEFIPYEQALALKELEFNEPCFGTWNGETLDMSLQIPSDDYFTKAPTFSQAFRWFREKYGLHKHICYFNDTNVWHGDLYKLANGGLMNAPMELTGYKTYEEAELACLIKLIEIVKNKKS